MAFKSATGPNPFLGPDKPETMDAPVAEGSNMVLMDGQGGRPEAPTPAAVQSGIDEAEAHANDPANASRDDSSSSGGSSRDSAQPGSSRLGRAKQFIKTLDSDPRSNSEKMASGAHDKRTKVDAKPGAPKSGAAAAKPGANAGKEAGGAGDKGPSDGGGGRLAAIGAGIKKRRGLTGSAGIAVLIATLLIGGFSSLYPFHLTSIMKNILKNRIESKIDHYFLRRLTGRQSLYERFFKASVGNNDKAFEKAIQGFDEPTKDLMRTWRKPPTGDPLEKQLELTRRITLKRAGSGIDIIQDGKRLGDLGNKKAAANLVNALADQTHAVSYIERGPFRQMAFIKYLVETWKVFNKKTGPDAEKEIDDATTTDAQARFLETVGPVEECALSFGAGSKCIVDEGARNPEDQLGVVDGQQSNTGNAGDSDLQSTVSDADATATSKAQDALHSAAEKLGPQKTSQLLTRILSKFLAEEVAKDIATIFAAAKGPLIILSAIDIGSRIDHFFWTGTADKVLIQAHKVQYAGSFFLWLSAADQQRDGKTVSGDEVNAANLKLEGSEKSAASRSIYGSGSGGQSLTTVNDGNGKGTTTTDVTGRSIDESLHPIEDYYKIINAAVPLPDALPGVQGGATWHDVFVFWYATGRHLWDVVNAVVGFAADLLIKLILNTEPWLRPIWNWVTTEIGNALSKLFLLLIKPAVDGTEIGADLVNGWDAGGAVAGEDFVRWLGGWELSLAQSREVNGEIAAETTTADSKLSLGTRLFSTDYPKSMVNMLALHTSTTPAGLLSDGMDYVASVFGNPFQTLQPALATVGLGTARAADNSPDTNYGLKDYGFTDANMDQDDTAQLNQAWQNAAKRTGKAMPVADAGTTGPTRVLAAATPDNTLTISDVKLDDCPEPADPVHQPNVCRLDIAMDRSFAADYTKADDGGLNSP